MKKLCHSFVFFLLAAVALVMTGCEDEMIAYDLEGTWSGNTHMIAIYDGLRYNSTYSELEFVTSPFRMTSGRGYWVNYYADAPWGCDYVASHIRWKVRDRVIEIYFEEDDYWIYIDNYDLDRYYFWGRIYWDEESDFAFRLRHVASPNWDKDYYYSHGGYYYSPSGDGAGKPAPGVERPRQMLAPGRD